MTSPDVNANKFQKTFLIVLALGISLVFFQMIRGFLTALLLAAIVSGMVYPLYARLLRWFKGRRTAASALTTVIVLLAIVVPLLAFLGIVASEAVGVAQGVTPWVEQQLQEPNQLERWLEGLPLLEELAPYQDQMTTKVAEWAGRIGNFFVGAVAATTRGTATFVLQLFIMLYAIFFFLMDGKKVLQKILYYSPLAADDEERMVGKFLSVSRATVKGTMIIGLVQGGLAGGALAVAGVQGAIFWGTIMVVLSIIPGIGTALVWFPAVIYLFAIGKTLTAILLFLWCAAVVGGVDNVLRPWLVGKDTKMPDLLILLGTLGGLVVFGAVGIVIGPIVAALFVTVWDLYALAFQDLLPDGGQGGVTNAS
ncbi:MAG: AI-2E family transporter [Gemmatimonadota bacterium]